MNEPYIHSTSRITGDVTIGSGSIVFPGAIISGDRGPVRIGKNVAVEDNCILNAVEPSQSESTSGLGLEIGDNVIIGHGAVISGSTIGSYNLIGIKAIVKPSCRTGEFCSVAAGSVLESGSKLRINSVVMGIPARLVSKSPKIASRWIQILDDDIYYFRRNVVSYLDGKGNVYVSPDAKVHPRAVMVGDVEIAANSVIKSGAVLRGDFGKVIVGEQVTISENSVLHAGDPESQNSGEVSMLTIGARVNVGRNVVLNGKEVGSDTIFADNAFMLHRAEIGKNCVVLSNSGVMTRMKVPDGCVVSGLPGKILGNDLQNKLHLVS